MTAMNRRTAMGSLGAGLVAIALTPGSSADEIETLTAIRSLFGEAQAKPGRVTLKLPPLAESGNAVPLTVTVDSPMTEADYVRRVGVFANRNPRPWVATVMLGPKAAKAEFSTNMRLSGTQDVIAIAEMSDGSLWSAQANVLVTVGACDSMLMRR